MKYVTYLTTYSGKLLPPFYIGHTSEEKILSGNYFGSVSSQKWKEIYQSEIINNSHLFSIEILSYHETREEAIAEELLQQLQRNVVKSQEYFNEGFAKKNGGWGCGSGEEHHSFGTKRSDASKEKMRNSKKGKTYEEIYGPEKAAKIKADRRKVWQERNPSTINGSPGKGRVGEAHPMFGKTHSEEAKRKIADASANRSDETKRKSKETKRKNIESGITKPTNLGSKQSEETIAKRVESKKRNNKKINRMKSSEETKEKQKLAMKLHWERKKNGN
jgi:hypothetical protein